ncbi:MAG: hypothetical protein JO033_19610, partial [Acidobacteriaceae bacterium]|nr:hypothetical protein [Acidobacteriaceae bacterium]
MSSTDLLQFPELKELLANYAGSAAGRELVFALQPHNNRPALESALAEAGEAIAYLREVSSAQTASSGAAIRLRFNQLRDVSNAIRILRMEGASLDGREILDLFHTLAIAGEYRGILLSVAERYSRLAQRARTLADL